MRDGEKFTIDRWICDGRLRLDLPFYLSLDPASGAQVQLIPAQASLVAGLFKSLMLPF